VCQLQRLLFKHWPQLRGLALASCAAAAAPDGLRRALQGLSDEQLRQLVCVQLRLVGTDDAWAEVGCGGVSRSLVRLRRCPCHRRSKHRHPHLRATRPRYALTRAPARLAPTATPRRVAGP
jgi:hypothetical protein